MNETCHVMPHTGVFLMSSDKKKQKTFLCLIILYIVSSIGRQMFSALRELEWVYNAVLRHLFTQYQTLIHTPHHLAVRPKRKQRSLNTNCSVCTANESSVHLSDFHSIPQGL